MTTKNNDPADSEGDDTGVLADAGSTDTTSIPMLSVATGHVSVELHHDEDDDDFEGDVVDDAVAVPFDAVATDSFTTDEVLVIELAEDEPADDGVVSDDTSEIAEVVIDEPSHDVGRAAGADPEASPDSDTDLDTDLDIDADLDVDIHGDIDSDIDAEIDTVAVAAHDEGVAEQIPEPQSAVSVRASNGVERAMTRHDVNVMAAKRLDDLSNADRETSDLLTADRLLDPHQVVRPEPEGPWRQFLYSISGHRINLGDSKKARARKALDLRIAASLPGGARFVPIVSRKGGVGKTTITTLLGMALADARDDRVIAVDANPDRGTLSERIARPSGKTVRDLVRGRERVHGYNDVSTVVARDETRLDVLASDTDPKVSEAFSDDDYRHVAEIAAHYYSIVLTDTGTGIVHSVMGATLELADQIVVVAGLSVDEARLASETLTWLESNGYESLVRNSIVVLNNARPGSPLVRQDEVEAHFRTRVRDVVRVPYDAQIAAGSAIHFRELQPETRLAARTLAAKVVEGLRALSVAA